MKTTTTTQKQPKWIMDQTTDEVAETLADLIIDTNKHIQQAKQYGVSNDLGCDITKEQVIEEFENALNFYTQTLEAINMGMEADYELKGSIRVQMKHEYKMYIGYVYENVEVQEN